MGLLLRGSSTDCALKLMSSISLSFMLWRAEDWAAADPLRGVGSATAIPGSLRPAVRGNPYGCSTLCEHQEGKISGGPLASAV